MESAYSKSGDVSDNSDPLFSPDKSIEQLPSMSPRKSSLVFELDLSKVNQEHLEPIPPSSSHHECITPKSTPPNKVFPIPIYNTKEFTPYTPNSPLEESQAQSNKSIVAHSSKKSILGKSVNLLVKKSVYPPTEGISGSTNPTLYVTKTSIGLFNSISQYSVDAASAAQEKFPLSVTKPLTKGKPCNCQKSKCLKLYCECFAKGKYCEGCSCTDCHNIDSHKQEVDKAREIIRDKNPRGTRKHWDEKPEDIVSCKCSKSECIKNYCECYKKGRKCGTRCDCIGCKNNPNFKTILCKSYDRDLKKDGKESI